jgi:hypothetical protein
VQQQLADALSDLRSHRLARVDDRPALGAKAFGRSRACVLFPEPSTPSKVMNMERA